MSDRHAFRAQWHDYNSGMYFVTVCTEGKLHYFGKIREGKMHLSQLGAIVEECVTEMEKNTDDVEVVHHVVMPNHVHLVIAIGGSMRYVPEEISTPSNRIGCIQSPRHGEPCEDNHFNSRLSVIIRLFKGFCTKRINAYRQQHNQSPVKLWQRNFHEHIIRTRRSYEKIMEYVEFNPDRWSDDCFNK